MTASLTISIVLMRGSSDGEIMQEKSPYHGVSHNSELANRTSHLSRRPETLVEGNMLGIRRRAHSGLH